MLMRACNPYNKLLSPAVVGCFTFLVLILATISAGCSKEKDTINPKITFLSPKEGSFYNTEDSIPVEAIASDETKLEFVQVQLTDLTYKVVGKPINVTVTSNPLHFRVLYPLSGLQLKGGEYYLRLTASDGQNIKYKYCSVYINSVSSSLREILTITSAGWNGFQLYKIDTSTLHPQKMMTWNHNYSSSYASMQNNQLYIAGKGIGECYAYSLYDFTLDFTLTQTGTPSIYYNEKITTYNELFYLGLTDGYVKGYNKLGKQLFIATMPDGRKPGSMIGHADKYLIVAEEQKNGDERWMSSYFLNGGSPWNSYKLPNGAEVTGMASISNSQLLIAANVNGDGRLMVWNIEANSFSTPWSTGAGELIGIEPFGSNKFLVGSTNGIVIYDALTATGNEVMNLFDLSHIKYDKAAETLYIVHGDTLSALKWPLTAPQWQTKLPGAALDLHLVY